MPEGKAVRTYRSIFLRYKLFDDEGIARRCTLAKRIIRRLGRAVGCYPVGRCDTHATA
jgi:hypothetical protein